MAQLLYSLYRFSTLLVNCKLICSKACIYWPFTLCPTAVASWLNICAYFGLSQLPRGQPQPWVWPAPLSPPRGDPHSLPPLTLLFRTPPRQSCCYPNLALQLAVKEMSSPPLTTVQKRSSAHPRQIPSILAPLSLHWDVRAMHPTLPLVLVQQR